MHGVVAAGRARGLRRRVEELVVDRPQALEMVDEIEEGSWYVVPAEAPDVSPSAPTSPVPDVAAGCGATACGCASPRASRYRPPSIATASATTRATPSTA